MKMDVSATLEPMVARPQASRCLPDLEHPNDARVFDYLLGGSVHWAVDRAFVRRLNQACPQFHDVVLAHRQFIRRVVRHLVGLGVRQFVDLGSGLLSKDNTHQLADEVAPDSRVVYVDNEPVVVAHLEVLLDEYGDPDRHAVIHADMLEPDGVWEAVQATGLLDPKSPVAVFMFSVLHHLKPAPGGTDLGARTVARYRDLLPVGSYLGVSHITAEGVSPALKHRLRELKHLCDTWYGHKGYARSRDEIAALLDNFEVIKPGLVWTPQWHPEDGECSVLADLPSEAAVLAGVGQKTRRSRPRTDR